MNGVQAHPGRRDGTGRRKLGTMPKMLFLNSSRFFSFWQKLGLTVTDGSQDKNKKKRLQRSERRV